MAQYLVPTPDGTSPATTQTTRIGGKDLVLTFRWRPRLSLWALDVAEYPDIPKASGLLIRQGINLVDFDPELGVLHLLGGSATTMTAFADSEAKLWYDDEWEGLP